MSLVCRLSESLRYVSGKRLPVWDLSKVKLGGRVKEANAKELIAKQLGEFASNLDGAPQLDLKTGRIQSKTFA